MTTAPGIDDPQPCRLCGGAFTVRALLERAAWFWPTVDVVVSATPCCGASEELRLADGRVERGYVYAAGGPHFCGMETYDAPALKVTRAGDRLTCTLDGVARALEARR
jgi:hypothetical protein